jgi:hypothetical protein
MLKVLRKQTPAAVENYGFLTFSTDFSTKISAAM